ncbi:MAG TPA: CvpA family protein, partial [Gaiellaceae bacterium]|nr:CvpA family protein [Gaiellaceae bacterium]
LFLGTANRVAGALFGCLKGAAIVGFGLLFVERVVPSPAVSSVIAGSQLGRPLEQLADTVVERGRELGTTVRERRA